MLPSSFNFNFTAVRKCSTLSSLFRLSQSIALRNKLISPPGLTEEEWNEEIKTLSRTGFSKGPVQLGGKRVDKKAVNDALGHGGGDVVLQAVAGVLRETVRGPDSVARIGGDEFCILLPDTGLAEALVVTERMRSRVEALVLEYRGQTVRVRASMGVASSESCGLSWKNLIEQSDAALYRAKRGGRNKVATTELEALGESGPLLD